VNIFVKIQGVYRTFQTLERLTFECGLRKLYKALVLDMEPLKKKIVEPQIFFVDQHFFVEQ